MSYSINNIIKPLVGFLEKIPSIPVDKLYNPDIPYLKYIRKFNDLVEIKDKAFSSLKLTTQPRNGGNYRLPRNKFDDDPRKDEFLMNGSIDPNIIRKRVNPDRAIPSLESAESTRFSLVPSNNVQEDFINLIQLAHKNYINYKNRFFVDDPAEKSIKDGSSPATSEKKTQTQTTQKTTTKPQTEQDIINIINQLKSKAKQKKIGIPTESQQRKNKKFDFNKYDDINVGIKKKRQPVKKPKPMPTKTEEFVRPIIKRNPNIFRITPTMSTRNRT